MQNFTKSNLNTLRRDIDAALEAVAEKHGISVNLGNARFDSTSVAWKLNLATIGGDGVAKTPERTALERLYPQLVDKEVTVNGKGGRKLTGTVIGYKTRGRKYPFIVKTAAGNYKLPEYAIR